MINPLRDENKFIKIHLTEHINVLAVQKKPWISKLLQFTVREAWMSESNLVAIEQEVIYTYIYIFLFPKLINGFTLPQTNLSHLPSPEVILWFPLGTKKFTVLHFSNYFSCNGQFSLVSQENSWSSIKTSWMQLLTTAEQTSLQMSLALLSKFLRISLTTTSC